VKITAVSAGDPASKAIHAINSSQLLNAGTLDSEGAAYIGGTGGAGTIDSGGGALNPTDLSIGSNSVTADINLGRSTKTVNLLGQGRMNGNAIILNDKASITSTGASGIKDNPTGYGAGGASIDFYINGTVVFYIDANGGHNA